MGLRNCLIRVKKRNVVIFANESYEKILQRYEFAINARAKINYADYANIYRVTVTCVMRWTVASPVHVVV